MPLSTLLLSLTALPLAHGAALPANSAAVQQHSSAAQSDSVQVETAKTTQHLGTANVSGKRRGLFKSLFDTQNTETLSAHELTRAACCNLGESFVNSPSVDVAYADAATGAKEIRLLGLAGTYVQMLTENVPSFRLAAQPFGLSYVPGTWMSSVQVSKGVSSVKNGFEPITGQVNVELKKPNELYPNRLLVNGYGDLHGRFEGNLETNLLPSHDLGTTILAHYEKTTHVHDENHDGLADRPRIEQGHLLNRWTYQTDHTLTQLKLSGLLERREAGQIGHHVALPHGTAPYRIDIDTRRWEATLKSAYLWNNAAGTNLAVMLSYVNHDQDANYDGRSYAATHHQLYGRLMLETKWHQMHDLSVGIGVQSDVVNRAWNAATLQQVQGLQSKQLKEIVPGAYVQYTFSPLRAVTFMAGARLDHSNLWGTFFTPRAHLRLSPWQGTTLRLSAGKGYRTASPLEEHNNFLAGSRRLVLEAEQQREVAWNYGADVQWNPVIADRVLKLNAEYFYTHFSQQAVADFDTNPHAIYLRTQQGKSFSHVVQVDATYPIIDQLNLTAAWRYTDVRNTYRLPDGTFQLLEKPLQSRFKGLLSLGYVSDLERWQVDATLQLNGGGRMPTAYTLPDGSPSWKARFSPYAQLSAQITHNYREWSFYVGGENLTSYRQQDAIVDAQNPRGTRFDPTMVYAPLDGAMVYVGFRYRLAR